MSEPKQFNTAKLVHRSLLKLFIIFWLCAALHLVVVMHGELRQEAPSFQAMAAAPPIVPVVMLSYGNKGAAALTIVLTLLAAVLWVIAVRRPQAGFLRLQARGAIISYWLVLWFGLAMSM